MYIESSAIANVAIEPAVDLDTRELFAGRSEIRIAHDNAIYRLRITRRSGTAPSASGWAPSASCRTIPEARTGRRAASGSSSARQARASLERVQPDRLACSIEKPARQANDRGSS